MTESHESAPVDPRPTVSSSETADSTLRPTRLMPLTTAVNLWMGPGLALMLLVVVVASLSLGAVRFDFSVVWPVIRTILPFALIGTAAVSLGLSIVNRPMRGAEHTLSTLSVLVPWLVILLFLRPLPVIPAAISLILCVAALGFARPKKFGESDGVESGGYQLPRSAVFGRILWVAGVSLLFISATAYVGWFVQSLIDPSGLTDYFGSATVESIRLRGGGSPSALAATIAGFYGNLVIGGILIRVSGGIRAPKPPRDSPPDDSSTANRTADRTAEDSVSGKPMSTRKKVYLLVGSWYVFNALLGLIIVAAVGLDFTLKGFYLFHQALAWIALCTWFFAKRGKDALLILGIFVGVFSLVIVLGIDLLVSFVVSLL